MRQTEILRRGFVCSYRCSTMHVHDPFFIIHLLFLRSISLAHLVAAGQYLLNFGYFKQWIFNFMRESSWYLTFCFAFGISAIFKPGHFMLYTSHPKHSETNCDMHALTITC